MPLVRQWPISKSLIWKSLDHLLLEWRFLGTPSVELRDCLRLFLQNGNAIGPTPQ